MYTEMRAGIHTENWGFVSEIPLKEIEKRSGKVLDKVREGTEETKGKINLNCIGGNTYMIENLGEYTETRKDFMEVMKMIDVKRNRIDICVDTDEAYKEAFKRSKLFIELIEHFTGKETYTMRKNRTRKDNSLWLKGTVFDIEIYDKELQKQGRVWTKTRTEFRWIRAFETKDQEGKDLKYFKETEKIMKLCLGDWERFEEERAEVLYNDFLEMKGRGIGKDTMTFVRYNEVDFFTLGIVEKFYKKTGVKTSKSKWVYNLTKGTDIKFITKTEMKKQVSDMVRALKMFVKGA